MYKTLIKMNNCKSVHYTTCVFKIPQESVHDSILPEFLEQTIIPTVDPLFLFAVDDPPKKYALLKSAPKFCGSTTSSRTSHKDGAFSSSIGCGMRDIGSNSKLPHLRIYPYDIIETSKFS